MNNNTTMAAEKTAPPDIAVTVRPIEPRGKLIGYASVTFGGAVTVHDFKVFNGEDGLFVGVPSVRDGAARSGFRETARLMNNDIKNQLNQAARESYVAEVGKLQARAAAVAAPEKPRIREQFEKAGKEAARDNAARNAPEKEKAKAARDDR
ncbi:MAG: SpoVG family protein [Clostridiales bacterium]|nr:SpoVG family protein [Clostridiales bacterium]